MKGRRWIVTPNGLKIGRDKSCEIPVDDLSAELFHCIVKMADGKPVVLNLASSRGVDVNGTNVDEAKLKENDVVRVGNERFVVVVPGSRNSGSLVRNVSICAILLGLAVIGAHFCRQRFFRGKPEPKPPAANVAKEKPEAVTTNHVVRLVGEEIVTTNRVVRIVDNVVVTNYVIEVRRGGETKVVGTVEDEVVVPPPGPTEGLKFSEDGKTLVFVPKDLTSVTIPDGVTAIADKAFENHKALLHVSIPPSVTTIGRDAFRGCDNMTGVFITDLAAWCRLSFQMDSNPWNVVWDNPLWYAHNLYLNGSLIRNMEIPKNVSSIGKHTFRGCTSLTRVLIPRNVTYIDAGAFADCGNLKEFAVAEDSRHYKSVDGLLLTKDGRTLVAVPGGIEAVKIPYGVVTIGDYAFLGCNKLSKVSIPDGVTSIGYRAYAKCNGLESIEIPPSVTKIRADAFVSCNRLKSVYITDIAAWCRVSLDHYGDGSPFRYTGSIYLNGSEIKDLRIPNDVKEISGYVFSGCDSLIRVTIPRTVERIGSGAFAKCGNLTCIDVTGSNKNYKSDDGLLLTKNGRTLVAVPAGLENVKVPNGVVAIGDRSFWGCNRLSEIKIPHGVSSISFNAFAHCAGLASVTIPDTVTSIAGWAFFDCKGLSNVVIPRSVRRMGPGVFQQCKFRSITIPGSVDEIEENAFLWSFIENVTIQDGVKRIGRAAFSHTRIKSISVPNSVTNIAAEAFNDCKQLESVTVPEGLTNIHERAFVGCGKLLDANGKPRLTRVPSTAKRK